MEMTNDTYKLIGVGLYTVAEAARLTGISPGRVRRWIRGYSFRSAGEIHVSPPVVRRERGTGDQGGFGLTFKELMEVRFVHAFLELGVTWANLRVAHDRAAKLLETSHPFATRRFFTDGSRILTRIGKPTMLDVGADQMAFSRIVGQYVKGPLDFEGQVPIRWWPMGRARRVVIDAARSFGQPIVSTEGVPTAVLHRAYLAEANSDGADRPEIASEPSAGPELSTPAVARVAKWFEVENRSVRAAVEYEVRLAA